MSEVTATGDHIPMGFGARSGFRKIAGLFPENVPVILESIVEADEIDREVLAAVEIMKKPDKRFVSEQGQRRLAEAPTDRREGSRSSSRTPEVGPYPSRSYRPDSNSGFGRPRGGCSAIRFAKESGSLRLFRHSGRNAAVGLNGRAAPIVTRVENHEVCFTTPTVELEPHASEHEGYLGNYGNTMGRWYRRAALVLWPEERALTVRAEAAAAWALKTMKGRIASGDVADVYRR